MLRNVRLLLLTLLVKARITVELTWNTEKVSYTCCQSNSQLLMWNFTEGVNERIIELQWFFNETTLICLDSKTIGFHVENLYDMRVDRNGTAGILLKNISLNDAGKYTLYVKLAEEKIRHFQHIFLTVDEAVPYQCNPIIDIQQRNVLHCSTKCFERSQLSSEWIINDTRGVVQPIGPYLRLDAGINEQALCCLRGLKCHDEEFKFCRPNLIPSNAFKEDIHTMIPIETDTIKAPNYETINVLILMCAIMTATFLLFVLVIVAYCLWRRHKSRDVKSKHLNIAEEGDEDFKEADIVAGTKADVKITNSQIVEECIDAFRDVNISTGTTADVKPKNSHAAEKCTEDIKVINTVAGSTEDRKLKWQLPSYKHEENSNTTVMYKSVEMTEVQLQCPHHNHSDTDTSDSCSNYEDAVSEPLVHHDWPDSIQFCRRPTLTV